MKLKIEYIKPDLLKEYEKNAKIHPQKQIDKIKKSIKDFGFLNPILIDNENTILAGHARLRAAKELKLDFVPVIKNESLTERQKKLFILADNRISELGFWDFDILKTEFENLDFDPELKDFGFAYEDFKVIDLFLDETKNENQDSLSFENQNFENENENENFENENQEPLKKKSPLTPLKVDHEFCLIVALKSEDDQKKLYQKLLSEGYETRLI